MFATPAFLFMAIFFVAVIGILYGTNKRNNKSLDEYAVGGRSYGPWFVAMSYVNSFFPGATFTAFFALSVGAGVFGFYALTYGLLGVTLMYLLATRAWRWGKRFNLRTQPDLIGMRFGSTAVKRLASVIGVVSMFPWLVLGVQSFAVMFEVGSGNKLSVIACLLLGLGVIGLRQVWTIRMGMRGLVMTDMFQGIVAYGGAGVVCLLMLFGVGTSPVSWSDLATLSDKYLHVPGDGGAYGPLYLFSLILTGVIGSLCWPMSFQRIYTAASVRVVKSATVRTIFIAAAFYTLLTLVALAATHIPEVVANPQAGWFTVMNDYGGSWMLGLAVVIMFAASMGWVDGAVQVAGLQVANDLINGGARKRLTDYQVTVVAKIVMVAFMVLAAFAAYFLFNFDRLQLLAQISYQSVVQLGVPLFLGVFWKRGNKQGALAGMASGFVIACVLTAFFPDDIHALGSLTSGIVALAVNLAVYVVCAYAIPQTPEERARIDDLFDVATGARRASTPTTESAPELVEGETASVR